MTTTHPAPATPAPGAVKVRLSGEPAGIDAVLALLATACEVLDLSGPRPNRYDPGQRVYLTVRPGPAPGAGCGPERHAAPPAPAPPYL